MHAKLPASLLSLAVALAIAGCQKPAEPAAPAADAVPAAPAAAAPATWPASLVVGTVDGVTLVSVPNGAGTPGDGDGQGDAEVAGTHQNATAQVRCTGFKGAAAGICDDGVVRDAETGRYVELNLPDGMKRTIFFNRDGSFLSFSTAQADGTAAMKISSRREGDTTLAMLGDERYEIQDVLIQGD